MPTQYPNERPPNDRWWVGWIIALAIMISILGLGYVFKSISIKAVSVEEVIGDRNARS